MKWTTFIHADFRHIIKKSIRQIIHTVGIKPLHGTLWLHAYFTLSNLFKRMYDLGVSYQDRQTNTY